MMAAVRETWPAFNGGDFRVITPLTTAELLREIYRLKGNNFRFGAGYTDLILDLRKQPVEDLTVINLSRLQDSSFRSIEQTDVGVRLGALVTVAAIGCNRNFAREFPVLVEAALSMASRQIRGIATVGGNICTASPAGDLSCALMALNAVVEIMRASRTTRMVTIKDFFTGARRTCLEPDEIVRSIHIPSNLPNVSLYSGFIKVGTRRSMECAVVSLAYHIQTDSDGRVVAAGVAIGSVAPTVRPANSAADFLVGKRLGALNARDINAFAERVMEYASPISDIRASAQYRSEAAFNISKGILESPDTAQRR